MNFKDIQQPVVNLIKDAMLIIYNFRVMISVILQSVHL